MANTNLRRHLGRTLYRVWPGPASAWLLGLALVAFGGGALGEELKPFASDGCSEFPDGTRRQKTLWQQCCIRHDAAYWLGGTYAQRQAADEQLKACVAEVGEPEIAALMLAGVRVGGSPYWPTRYRWGYGWPYWNGAWPRGYKAISDEERQRAKALLPAELRAVLFP